MLGDFSIERELGRGGMGVVYLARQRSLGRAVALKVLPKEFTANPVRLRRFKREAEAICRVDHPNVVPVYAVGEDRGTHWIAMKYVLGTPLDQVIRGRRDGGGEDWVTLCDATAPLSAPCEQEGDDPEPARHAGSRTTSVLALVADPGADTQWVLESVRLCEKLGRALSHLHAEGIVHRDVKPANVIVDRRGEPWLVDFGLVRDAGLESISDDQEILGTLHYLPPEHLQPGQAPWDRRADVYSLGVTLYELVTLRKPFDAKSTGSVLHAVATARPAPPGRLNRAVGHDLETVILKAIEKDPAQRYASAEALADDLRRILEGERVAARPTRPLARLNGFCRRRPLAAVLAGVACLAFTGLFEYAVWRGTADWRRREQCLLEGDAAFEQGNFLAAAENYGIFARLGGDDPGVLARLDASRRMVLRATLRADTPPEGEAPGHR